MPSTPRLDASTVERLYGRSNAPRWGVALAVFQAAIERSVAHAFTGRDPTPAQIAAFVDGLHLEDLALAVACAAGSEAAWDHFVREFQPVLRRAADAIDPTGGARELADALHADLYGLKERDGERMSLFRYFHGRSSLGTWLRAVLSQRLVDRVRDERRLEPLPDDDVACVPGGGADPDRPRHEALVTAALAAAIDALAPRDRLRLSLYYAQDLSLAAIGKTLREHEATVSRHLTRARAEIRRGVEERLRTEHGFDDRTIAECVRAVIGDPGSIDIAALTRPGKNPAPDRSS